MEKIGLIILAIMITVLRVRQLLLNIMCHSFLTLEMD